MKKRLAGLRLDASNRQVAEILRIPKGTVDSALYSIKKKFGVK
jgi:DNA-binding CsgD family transcriptional regulator